MISRLPLALPVSVFRDDEPVIQSHPVLEGACPPLFGNTGCWDLNGIVRRAPNLAAAGFRVTSASWTLSGISWLGRWP
ncbi:hypothetical protein [Streptomyces sp. NPDC051636]|uniref:hypothetical protein n=1 Tax=Streptomyces sp. NPDC051636 TaxID=3365663 RepID=UPI0037949BC9